MSHDCFTTDFSIQADLSPLEQEVLSQYQSLALKLYKLSDEIKKIHQKDLELVSSGIIAGQAHALLQNMRGLERKLGLVYTHFRTAVYSFVMRNEITENSTESRPKGRLLDTTNTQGNVNNEEYVRELVSDDEGTMYRNIGS